MKQILKIDNGLFRILVPFEDLTTTVYVYECEDGVALIDCATYSSDVDQYIVPALKELNIAPDEIKYLLLSHNHGDHVGGIYRLAEVFPNAIIGASFDIDLKNKKDIADNKTVIGNLKAIHLPGHTEHAFAFFDEATKTLLSADCLQLKGIGKYRNGIGNAKAYIDSANKLKDMDIKRIVTAHEYDPLGSVASGEEEVLKYLDMCIEIAKKS